MQLPHNSRVFADVIRPARLLTFSPELPPESQSGPEANPETKADVNQPLDQSESGVQRTETRERREDRNRREGWERHCEQLTNKELLNTLGDLRLRKADAEKQRNGLLQSSEPDRWKQISERISLIHEQQATARQDWLERKGKPLVNELAEEIAADEVSDLQSNLAKARERLKQVPDTSSRYAEERLKTAILEEQKFLAETAQRLAARRRELGGSTAEQ